MNKKFLKVSLVMTMTASLLLAGCGNTNTPKNNENTNTGTKDGLTGTITFTVNRSEEEVARDYKPIADAFMKENPNAKVNVVVAEKDPNVARTQLNAGEFPDVSIVPRDLQPTDLPKFYLPIGKVADLSKEYQYSDLLSLNGDSYALPNGVTHAGMLYNKSLVDKYLGGNVPKTLDEWYKAAETLKANNIVPLWTNAGAKWPMAEWDRIAIEISGDPGYRNSLMTQKEPWAEGTPLTQMASIFANFTKNKWIEEDTVLGQWDNSKTMFAEGKIGFMVLGSWAVPQMKDIAKTIGKNPDDIGFTPVPYKNDVSKDSPLNVLLVEDMMYGINKEPRIGKSIP